MSNMYKNVNIKIHKIIILPAVLYGCVTWSLALREEHRLRVFENRLLRGIFERKRDKVTGGWRILQNEELHNLYSSPSIIRMIKSRRMRWVGHVARMGRRGMHMEYFGGKARKKETSGNTKTWGWIILKLTLER
jgi:hypothetical protein